MNTEFKPKFIVQFSKQKYPSQKSKDYKFKLVTANNVGNFLKNHDCILITKIETKKGK